MVPREDARGRHRHGRDADAGGAGASCCRRRCPGILTGVMLAVARAAGETAPLLFTALFSDYWMSRSSPSSCPRRSGTS